MTSVSVVVATYEWPEALDAVLFALSEQTVQAADVIVADDGSGPATAAVVERWGPAFAGRLRHAWQEDAGFRLGQVKNLGARLASGDVVALVDGDAVPRRGFVEAIRDTATPGWFVAGKRLELDRELTAQVLDGRLPIHRWSAARWLRVRGHARPWSALTRRDRRLPGRDGLPEFVPHANRYGSLLGVWRSDFERVDGFDHRFEGWGEEDVDLAVRLGRSGLRCGWPGPGATLLHLWHESRKGERRNLPLLEETQASDRVRSVTGLSSLP